MEPQDYDLDKTGDMYIVDGDWAAADSNQVDIELILATSPGAWKQNPLTGFGIQQYLNADVDAVTIDEVESGIKTQLQANAFNVKAVDLELANQQIVNININADRQV